jgi:hypothetical protein
LPELNAEGEPKIVSCVAHRWPSAAARDHHSG